MLKLAFKLLLVMLVWFIGTYLGVAYINIESTIFWLCFGATWALLCLKLAQNIIK